MLLAIAAPLLLSLLVCQLSTGLCVLLAVAVSLLLLADAVSLLLPLLVCQPGTGLYVLLVVTVLLLLPGCDGHAVEIVLKFLVQDNNISEVAATSSVQDQI